MPTSPNWEKLKQIIADELYVPPSRITPEASLSDLAGPGWDAAVDLIALTMALEDEFKVSFEDIYFDEIEIISDLLAYIDEHTSLET
jgi:acyl carrier protein